MLLLHTWAIWKNSKSKLSTSPKYDLEKMWFKILTWNRKTGSSDVCKINTWFIWNNEFQEILLPDMQCATKSYNCLSVLLNDQSDK